MKHTKKLLLLGALAALAVFVAGCGAQSGGDGSDGGTEQTQAAEEKSLTGTLDEVKDFMFVVTDDSGVSYSLTLEGGEATLDGLAAGDRVTVTYTGVLSEVDAFEGTVLSVVKAE